MFFYGMEFGASAADFQCHRPATDGAAMERNRVDMVLY
jgi:hypothetical protein